jgi:hypothetical protein
MKKTHFPQPDWGYVVMIQSDELTPSFFWVVVLPPKNVMFVFFFPDGFVDGIYQLISMMDSMEIHDGPKTGLVDGFHSAPWNYEKLPWNLLGKIHDPSDFGAPFPFFVGLSFLKERSLCVSRSASI